jgi:hypothetical protein
MSKELFLSELKQGTISINTLYDYYNEFNTKEDLKLSFQEFEAYFGQYLNHLNMQIINGQAGKQKLLHSVINHYCKKYKIVTVKDKESNVLDYYINE